MTAQRAGWIVFWLVALAVGAIFPFAQSLAGLQDADGILTAIMSTEHLTWYFWGQNRLLNLLPALASVIPDIEWNLRAQIFLRAALAWSAPLAILVFFSRSSFVLLAGTVIANLLLVFGLTIYPLFNIYVHHNPFGTSMTLFAVCWMLVEDRPQRPPIALAGVLVLAVLAYAVNFAMLVYSLPFIVCLAALDQERRALAIRFFKLNLVAVLCAIVLSKLGDRSTDYGVALSLDALTSSWQLMMAQAFRNGVLQAALGLSVAALLIFRPRRGWLLAAVIGIAAMNFVLLSNLKWVQAANFNVRYFLPAMIAVASVAACLLTSLLVYASARLKARSGGYVLMGVSLASLLLMPAMVSTGLGGFDPANRELHGPGMRLFAPALAQAAQREGARAVIGGFWETWPAIFEIHRLRGAAASRETPIFGITSRGHVRQRRFLQDFRGKGEQPVLCLLASVAECEHELRAVMRQLQGMAVTIRETGRLRIEGKDVLQLRLAIA